MWDRYLYTLSPTKSMQTPRPNPSAEIMSETAAPTCETLQALLLPYTNVDAYGVVYVLSRAAQFSLTILSLYRFLTSRSSAKGEETEETAGNHATRAWGYFYGE